MFRLLVRPLTAVSLSLNRSRRRTRIKKIHTYVSIEELNVYMYVEIHIKKERRSSRNLFCKPITLLRYPTKINKLKKKKKNHIVLLYLVTGAYRNSISLCVCMHIIVRMYIYA